MSQSVKTSHKRSCISFDISGLRSHSADVGGVTHQRYTALPAHNIPFSQCFVWPSCSMRRWLLVCLISLLFAPHILNKVTHHLKDQNAILFSPPQKGHLRSSSITPPSFIESNLMFIFCKLKENSKQNPKISSFKVIMKKLIHTTHNKRQGKKFSKTKLSYF